MFDTYVRVRKSEVKELEKHIDDALAVLKELHHDVAKLKAEKEILERENTFLKGLVDKLATPTFNDIAKQPSPWEQPYGPIKSPYSMNTSCGVCGLQGINGYVCTRIDCPTGVSCKTNS